jgi:ParB-like chromosome segregation protein Spo0J
MNNKIYKYHQYANLFPLLEREDYNNLKEDINKNGLLESIYLYNDKIIDGRNRYRCCIDLGIEPIFKQYDGEEKDLLSFILSLNLHRRHLSESQRSIIAAKLANLDPGRPASNLIVSIATVSQSDAAAALDVSRVSVNRANRVLNRGSEELVDLVESGKLGVLPASEVATLDEQDQDIIIARGEEEILAAAKEIRNRNKPVEDEGDPLPEPKFITGTNESSSEWWTSDFIKKPVYDFFGDIDLDPCSNSIINPNIKAKKYYTKEMNGLNRPWVGKVFVNPPFSKGLCLDFVNKSIDEIENGNVKEIIFLMPSNVGVRWSNILMDNNFIICCLNKHVKFISPTHKAIKSPYGSILYYFGPNRGRFKDVFKEIGFIYTRDG